MARQIYGRVNPDGSVSSGSGFRVTRYDSGWYLVEFDQPFYETPVATATVSDNPWRSLNMSVACLDDLNPRYAMFQTSTPDRSQDCGFTFTVIGD